jgi:hypothetical protein
MESTPSSLTTSANSVALTDLRDSTDWVRLRNAVKEPVREMIVAEVDTEPRAREIVSALLAGAPSRPHHVLEFDAIRDDPAQLLAAARSASAKWVAEEGLLVLLDVSHPRLGEDDQRARAFWEGMNLLREQWDALSCQTLFLLLPFHYRLLSSSADHLKRWMSLKVHLLPAGADAAADQLQSAEARQAGIGLQAPAAARQTLTVLEEQLREAIRRGEPASTLVRRYYLPVFAAAVSLGDLARARRVRKKLAAVEIPESELPAWFNLSVSFEVDQYHLAEARAIAERHLQWAQKRKRSAEEAIACFNLGRVAQEQRDLAGAERWYLRSLAIEEKQGNEHGAAINYHQLGRIAQEQRDLAGAERWCLKSLAIKEKQGDEHGAAITYHQLGVIAQERRDFAGAERWYLKSLAIEEKQGNEHDAAITYHQLGIIAQEQRDFAGAERWYLKSLAIKEKQGNEHAAAMTHHQLGRIAEEQRDFAGAERWYLKSLAISEKQGNEHGAAMTYHQLGSIAEEQRDLAGAERWYLKSLAIKEKQGDEHGATSTYH